MRMARQSGARLLVESARRTLRYRLLFRSGGMQGFAVRTSGLACGFGVDLRGVTRARPKKRLHTIRDKLMPGNETMKRWHVFVPRMTTKNGVPWYWDVKTTTGCIDAPFSLSDYEVQLARLQSHYCIARVSSGSAFHGMARGHARIQRMQRSRRAGGYGMLYLLLRPICNGQYVGTYSRVAKEPGIMTKARVTTLVEGPPPYILTWRWRKSSSEMTKARVTTLVEGPPPRWRRKRQHHQPSRWTIVATAVSRIARLPQLA